MNISLVKRVGNFTMSSWAGWINCTCLIFWTPDLLLEDFNKKQLHCLRCLYAIILLQLAVWLCHTDVSESAILFAHCLFLVYVTCFKCTVFYKPTDDNLLWETSSTPSVVPDVWLFNLVILVQMTSNTFYGAGNSCYLAYAGDFIRG